MENNKYLSRDKTQALIDELKVKQADGKAFLDGLAAKGYTIEGFNDQQTLTKETGLLDKLSQRKQSIDSTVTDPNINPLRATVRGFGQIAGGVNDAIGAGIGAVASTANNLTGGALGEAASSIGQSIFETPVGKQGIELAKQGMDAYGAWKQSNPEYAKDLEAVLNIASLFPSTQVAVKGAAGATDITLRGVKSGIDGAKTLPGKVSNVSKSIQNIGKTPKTLEGVVGEIAQGTTETINPVKTALSIVDTSKVNTYSDLLGQIKKTIPGVAEKVDNEFLKDGTIYSLDNLAVKQTTKAGTEVTTDYVTKGLNELKDFYTSVGDDVAKADIQDLITKSTAQGLTKKEVNDIARLHGRELSAYNANGQLASGLSKQAAENTRQGLKTTARQGLSEEAKNLDSQISALYDTQALIEKNVEKVNKLKQLVQDRGLVEKIGYNFSKYADILTGGSIRGLVGGILPRGVGNKVMNALDLEEKLRSNLDIIEKALKQKTDAGIIKVLNTIQSSKAESALSNSSRVMKTTAMTNPTITKNNNIPKTIPQTTKGASGGGAPHTYKFYSEKMREDIAKKVLADKSKPVIIDPDFIKKQHPDFDPKNPMILHDDSSAFAKELYKRAIDEDTSGLVRFTGGGAGSGKSEVLMAKIADRPQVLVDGTMAGLASNVKRIDQALELGKKVEIYPVYAPVGLSTLFNRMRQRSVSPEIMVETHAGMRDTIPKLIEKYGNKIKVIPYENKVFDSTRKYTGDKMNKDLINAMNVGTEEIKRRVDNIEEYIRRHGLEATKKVINDLIIGE